MRYIGTIRLIIKADSEDEAQAIMDIESKALLRSDEQIEEAWVEELGEFVDDNPENHN